MSSARENRWSLAEAAVLAEVPLDQVRRWAEKSVVTVDDGHVSDDDVIRLAALQQFSGESRWTRRRIRRNLRALELPSTPYFLVCHSNGAVVAVDPDRVAEHVSVHGEFRGFDPAPIRQRLGLPWSDTAR